MVLLILFLGLVLMVRCVVESAGPDPRVAVSPTPLTSPSAAGAAGLPPCRIGDEPAAADGYQDWERTLVDTIYALPADYAPPNLVSVGQAGFLGDFEVKRELISDLTKLRKAADRNDTPLGIVAAYRSFADQQDLFATRTELQGKESTLDRTARPGHSEHQLGAAIDFRDADAADVTPSWGNSPAGQWMEENAWQYGFVLSYPRGQQDFTCYDYEPWHFRYVGKPAAAEIHASGEALREYLWNEQ